MIRVAGRAAGSEGSEGRQGSAGRQRGTFRMTLHLLLAFAVMFAVLRQALNEHSYSD